jgi:hypothetical protein
MVSLSSFNVYQKYKAWRVSRRLDKLFKENVILGYGWQGAIPVIFIKTNDLKAREVVRSQISFIQPIVIETDEFKVLNGFFSTSKNKGQLNQEHRHV